MIDLAELHADLERFVDDLSTFDKRSPANDIEVLKVRALIAIAQRLETGRLLPAPGIPAAPEPEHFEAALKTATTPDYFETAKVGAEGDWHVGQRISRPPFGPGTIIDFPDPNSAAVRFDDGAVQAVAITTLLHEGEQPKPKAEPQPVAHAAPRVGDTDPNGDFDLELPIGGAASSAGELQGDFEPGLIPGRYQGGDDETEPVPSVNDDEALLGSFLDEDDEDEDDDAE